LDLWPKAKEAHAKCVCAGADGEAGAGCGRNGEQRFQQGRFETFIGSESVQVTLDKAGRICLPEKMATDAGSPAKRCWSGASPALRSGVLSGGHRVKASDSVMAQEALS